MRTVVRLAAVLGLTAAMALTGGAASASTKVADPGASNVYTHCHYYPPGHPLRALYGPQLCHKASW